MEATIPIGGMKRLFAVTGKVGDNVATEIVTSHGTVTVLAALWARFAAPPFSELDCEFD
jgi:hypothetical protein